MAETGVNISYQYKSEKYSQAVVRHVFQYLSALTGIRFYPDDQSPAISNIADNKHSKFIITRDNDHIAEIASRLTLSIRMGPYSNDRHAPSTEPLLSEIIGAFIVELYSAGLVPKPERSISLWPANHRCGLAVTHDVDIMRRTVLGGLRLVANNHLPGGWDAVRDSLRWRLGLNRNPYNCLGNWQKLEDEMRLKSTYFIFAGRRQHNFDPTYGLSLIPFDNIKNCSIALHSSIGCNMGQGLSEAKGELENKSRSQILGIRPHYLSAFFPEFWQAAADIGFGYSSTLGFDDAIGFVRGIDLPFYPFDTARDRPLPILEIPIAIMDCGLIGISDANSPEIFSMGAELIDRVARSGGLIVLDWHQRTLYNRDYPGWGELFRKLIKAARDKNAHFTTLEEISSFMKSRFEARI